VNSIVQNFEQVLCNMRAAGYGNEAISYMLALLQHGLMAPQDVWLTHSGVGVCRGMQGPVETLGCVGGSRADPSDTGHARVSTGEESHVVKPAVQDGASPL
jgi:hypothetical protein